MASATGEVNCRLRKPPTTKDTKDHQSPGWSILAASFAARVGILTPKIPATSASSPSPCSSDRNTLRACSAIVGNANRPRHRPRSHRLERDSNRATRVRGKALAAFIRLRKVAGIRPRNADPADRNRARSRVRKRDRSRRTRRPDLLIPKIHRLRRNRDRRSRTAQSHLLTTIRRVVRNRERSTRSPGRGRLECHLNPRGNKQGCGSQRGHCFAKQST
jgi:hypothetical protein